MMRNRILSLVVSLALCLSLTPAISLRANAQTLEVGTDCRYEDLISAIHAANSGDTIVLKTNAFLQNGDDIALPLVIEKELTICSEGMKTLIVRQNGILLNADMTLRDLCIDYTALEINGIFANGHKLTCQNVKSVNETTHLRLYAGGFYGENGWRGTPGEHGQVIVEADSAESTCVGMVLACGLSAPGLPSAADWTVPSTVTVTGPVKFDPNYVSSSLLNAAPLSAVMGCFPGEYSADNTRKHSLCAYAAGDPIQVVLNDCGTISVDGRCNASAANAHVTVNGGMYQTSPALPGIAKLTVAAGNVQPGHLENGAALAVDAGTILDLSKVMADGSYTASGFAGGGILRMPNDSLLTVTGAVTGKTEFQSTYYQNGGTSGVVTVGHTFIQTPVDTAEAAFTFHPFVTQASVELRKNAQGGWYTAIKEASDQDISIVSIDLPDDYPEPVLGADITSDFFNDNIPDTVAWCTPLWYGGTGACEYGTTADYTFEDNCQYRLEIVLDAESGYCFRPDILLPEGFSPKDEIPAAGCASITIVKTYTFGTVEPPDPGTDNPSTDEPGSNPGTDNPGTDEPGSNPGSGQTVPDDTADTEASRSYSDVPGDYWGADAIAYVASRNYFLGVSETQFAPEQPMTRQMVMAVLARVAGADTDGDAYAKGMAWAVSAGISDGSAPRSTVTRQQLIAMLYRYVGSPPVETQALAARYTDSALVADYALAAMAWATQNGIIQGMTETTLAPEEPTTRAQTAAILMRFDKLNRQA